MERFAQLIDELEDLVAVLRHSLGLWPARRGTRRS